MPLPRHPAVALSVRMAAGVLLLLGGCSSDAAFPTGSYATTIEAADRPPSAALVDDYRLDLRADGYVLEGAGFTARGTLVVDGDTVELRDDDRCEPGTVGRYSWRTDADGRLVFTALEQDPCDRPLGGRQFVLTRHPWSP